MQSNHAFVDENLDIITNEAFEVFCNTNGFEIIFTPRLEHQFKTYVVDMIGRLTHARRQAGRYTDLLVRRTREQMPWKCQVLTIEFPKQSHFVKAREEYWRYEAKRVTQKDTHLIVERIYLLERIKEACGCYTDTKYKSSKEIVRRVFDSLVKATGTYMYMVIFRRSRTTGIRNYQIKLVKRQI